MNRGSPSGGIDQVSQQATSLSKVSQWAGALISVHDFYYASTILVSRLQAAVIVNRWRCAGGFDIKGQSLQVLHIAFNTSGALYDPYRSKPQQQLTPLFYNRVNLLRRNDLKENKTSTTRTLRYYNKRGRKVSMRQLSPIFYPRLKGNHSTVGPMIML